MLTSGIRRQRSGTSSCDDLDRVSVHQYDTRLRRRQLAMNPDMQIILDELARRFTDHEAKLDQCLVEQESRWEATFSGFVTDQQQYVSALEKASGVFDDWCTNIEGTMDDLRLEVGKVTKHWECAVFDKSTAMLGVLAPMSPATDRQSVASTTISAHGHHVDMNHREDGFGSITTLVHPLVKGTCFQLPSTPVQLGDGVPVPASGILGGLSSGV